jgi:hypothetical protein
MDVRRGLLAFACLVLLGASCHESPHPYHVSAPEEVPPGALVKLETSGRLVLRLPSLKLGLVALDATPVATAEAIPSLLIRFDFDPETPSYSFDPMRVSVRTPEGKLLRPRAFVGPGRILYSKPKKYRSDRYCAQPIKGFWADFLSMEAGYELPARTESTAIPLSLKKTCFVVSFDTTVELGSRVEVLVDGIANGPEPVAVPPLPFSRRTGRSHWFDVRPRALN